MFTKPVRNISKKGKGSRRVQLPMSPKIMRSPLVESTIEADLGMILEVDPNVEFYCEQPYTFTYRKDWKDHKYTPDFWARLKNSSSELMVEVKPWGKANSEKWQSIFALVRPVIEAQGYKFLVLTDRDIRRMPRLKNVKEIFHGSRDVANTGHLIKFLEAANGTTEMTLAEASRLAAANDNLPNPYTFIRSGLAAVDMSKPLNDNAVICFGEP